MTLIGWSRRLFLTSCVLFLSLDSIANKLHMQKVSDFALSPGAQPSKVRTCSQQHLSRAHVPSPPSPTRLSPAGRRLRPRQQRRAVVRAAVSVPGAGRDERCACQQELLQGGQGQHAVEPERWASTTSPEPGTSPSPVVSPLSVSLSVRRPGHREHRGG